MDSVVATIVAMVFFFAVFAARAPAMGNSADRDWQLSQLVEGVSTAFNPSHGSLSYVQAGHCVSKQIGWRDAVCQGCPRAFLARRKLVASGSSRAPCAFPNLRCCPRCWLFSCLGFEFPTPLISPKEHQKERCGHSWPQRSFITFHGALRNILLSAGFPATFHMITSEQTFVNDSLQKIFSCWCHF